MTEHDEESSRLVHGGSAILRILLTCDEQMADAHSLRPYEVVKMLLIVLLQFLLRNCGAFSFRRMLLKKPLDEKSLHHRLDFGVAIQSLGSSFFNQQL